MRTIKSLILALSVIIFVNSCQKDYDPGSLSPAIGGLTSDISGDCSANIVSGVYKVAAATGSSNKVAIQVNVTATGSYLIITDTINGYYFKAAGNFATTGLSTVELRASGTPLAAGTDDFTVVYDTTACNFAVTVLPASTPGTGAVFTLGGAGTACTGASIQGIFKAGIALNGTNNLIIQVNVTTVGAYTISTTTINGMTFSATGSFSNTGVQTVTLNGSGTPATAGTNTISVNSFGNSCTYALTVQPAVTPNAVYTLASAANVCSNAVAGGTYAVNSALSSDNTIDLQVNVTAVGGWTITTAAVNGMTFSGSGNFNSTGIQTISLTGAGTPLTAGANVIPFTAGSSTCNFTITVGTDPNVPACNPPNNTAEFSNLFDINFTYVHGAPFGGAYKITGNGSNGDITMEFAGNTQPTAGIYRVQPQAGDFIYGDVRISLVNQNIYWQCSSGKVFVTVANGRVTAVFCDISFSGSLGGPSYTTIVDAKVIETD